MFDFDLKLVVENFTLHILSSIVFWDTLYEKNLGLGLLSFLHYMSMRVIASNQWLNSIKMMREIEGLECEKTLSW